MLCVYFVCESWCFRIFSFEKCIKLIKEILLQVLCFLSCLDVTSIVQAYLYQNFWNATYLIPCSKIPEKYFVILMTSERFVKSINGFKCLSPKHQRWSKEIRFKQQNFPTAIAFNYSLRTAILPSSCKTIYGIKFRMLLEICNLLC